MATAEAQVKPEEMLAELRKQGASNAEALAEVTKKYDDVLKSNAELKSKLDAPDFGRLVDAGMLTKRNPWELSKDYRPWGEFKSTADFVRAGLTGHGTHQFAERMQKHFSVSKAISGMSDAVGADGGFTVIPEFSTQIYEKVYSNDLLTRTDNYTVGGNSMTFMANSETSRANGSRHGGLRGYWTAEGGTITSSNPGFRELQLKLQKLAVVVYLTDELLADTSVALEQYIARKAAEEFNFLVGDSLINGSGVGQPQGILSSPALVSVAKETGQAAATLTVENIAKMWSRMYAPSRANAVWYINQDIEPQLNLMSLGVGAAGVPVYLPAGGISGTPYATIYGRPVIATEFNSTLGTQGDIILADLGQYVTITKGGIAQAQSMHVEFLTDQTALRFIMRINGQTWENSPITPYKGTATQSSFVTLDTRA